MKNRVVIVVTVVCLVSTSTGCGTVRNFLFGRGARCGQCSLLSRPSSLTGGAVAAAPTCNTPTYVQPSFTANLDQGSCGCNGTISADTCGSGVIGSGSSYGPVLDGSPVVSGYPTDPYSGTVIGSSVLPGTVYGGGPIYGDNFYPADRASSFYGGYPETGYKVDRDGNRILYEEPLPPGAMAVN